MTASPERPLLRYHGGKWMLAPWILEHCPPHSCYVEPFGGGGSVLLRKKPAFAEVYNDLDGDVVGVFRMARTRGKELQEALRLTPFARDEFRLACEPTDEPLEAARRCIVRAFFGFGSDGLHFGNTTGFRAKALSSGTTPARDWQNYTDAFSGLVARLAQVVIENRDACEVICAFDGEETLHYVDPPYVSATRRVVGEGRGYAVELDEAGHRRLAETLRRAKGMVVLSGYPSPLYSEIYPEWQMVSRVGLADGARRRTEVLWLNAAAWDRQAQLVLPF